MSTKNDLWDEFLSRWPIAAIENLTLEEYVGIGDKDTLAYWLEQKTSAVGSIAGGSSSKFGIYKRSSDKRDERKHMKHDDIYTWHYRFGENSEEAFTVIKKRMLSVITESRSGDLLAIDSVDLSDTLKWKMAFFYQDRNAPKILNIFSLAMLQKACNWKDGTHPETYKQLMVSIGEKELINYGEEIWMKLGEQDKLIVKSDSLSAINHNPPLNSILYGPPGTGKTYATINKALEILDPAFLVANRENRSQLKTRFDELTNNNRVAFVTFHQSFSYEDFVEGLKAETDTDGGIKYEVEDGIFKIMCGVASVIPQILTRTELLDVTKAKVWKMSLGDTLGDDAYIYEQCIRDGYVVLGYGRKIDFTSATDKEKVIETYRNNGEEINDESTNYSVTAVHNFRNVMVPGDIIVISDGNKKFRAIGEIVGDYRYEDVAQEEFGYAQIRDIRWLTVFTPSLPKEELFNKNLSQMTLYRLKPPTLDLDKLDSLINTQTPSTEKQTGITQGDFIDDYEVLSVSKEIIQLRKPNGSLLPLPRTIVDEIISLVKEGKISVSDIKNKKIFEKILDSNLAKYIVNGYPSIIAPLVERISLGGYRNRSNITDKRVLIIDEINRGNIANIFGELITLIEPSKRAGSAESLTVKLPYSKKPFSVPSNLHIIGTMNTADKSLAQVDIALRRRFEFIEMMPNYRALADIPEIEGIDIALLLETLNQRIELLYDREHTIGHSFFLPLLDKPTIYKLASIFELQILPLLEEYFFEDWERVGQVLGDHLKKLPEFRFVKEKFNSELVTSLMGSDWEMAGPLRYERNLAALLNPQAYIGIYEEG
jgi:5-methylcytosine-specific restriction protein B